MQKNLIPLLGDSDWGWCALSRSELVHDLPFAKISILKEGIMEKISYGCRVYESEDDCCLS